MVFLRKYATLLASGTRIGIPLIKAGATSFATSSDWTPGAGDVKVSLDGGAEANIANLPTYSNGSWLFVLTAAELTAKRVSVRIIDPAVENDGFEVETFGHANAMYTVDWQDAAGLGLSRLDTNVGSRSTLTQTQVFGYTTVTAITTAQDAKAIIEAATAGTLCLLGPGTHSLSGAVTVPDGVDLRGAGRGETILTGAIANALVTGGVGSIIKRLSIINTQATTGQALAAKNRGIIRDVYLRGEFDGLIVGSDITDWLMIEDVHSEASYDPIAVVHSGAGLTTIRNCVLVARDLGNQQSESNGLVVRRGRVVAIDCEIDQRNANTSSSTNRTGVRVQPLGGGAAVVELFGCRVSGLVTDLRVAATGTGGSTGSLAVSETVYDPAKTDGTFTTRDTPGNVTGKVLGSGSGVLAGTGVRADDRDGNALATAANQTTLLTAIGTRAAPGDAMALTGAQVTALVAALEAEIADDATGAAVKQAIIDKLIENLPDLDDLTLAAIGNSARDAVLNALLAGFASNGSVGKAIGDILTSAAAAKSAAESADTKLDNKPSTAQLEGRTLPTAQYATAAAQAAIQEKTDELQFQAGRVLADAAVSLDAQQIADLADAIAAQLSFGGDGDTPVDHNTGGVDALRYTRAGGSGADNVRIQAYLKSEYDAGTRTLRGQAYTGPDGRWLTPLMLNAGFTYYLIAKIPGATQAVVTEVTP